MPCPGPLEQPSPPDQPDPELASSPPPAVAAPPAGSAALEAARQELAQGLEQLAELDQLVVELPGIFERKFAERLQPLLDRQRLLSEDNHVLRQRLQLLLPPAQAAAAGLDHRLADQPPAEKGSSDQVALDQAASDQAALDQADLDQGTSNQGLSDQAAADPLGTDRAPTGPIQPLGRLAWRRVLNLATRRQLGREPGSGAL